MVAVSIEQVKAAFRNTLGQKGMDEDGINDLAEYILSFFGYTDHVIDNKLTSDDRDVFYQLEEVGFLTTTQEEVHLRKGKLWRIHYWILKTDQIERMAKMEVKEEVEEDVTTDIYDSISEEVWNRG